MSLGGVFARSAAPSPANQRAPESHDLSPPQANLIISLHSGLLRTPVFCLLDLNYPRRFYCCSSIPPAMASTQPLVRLVAYRRPSPALLNSALRSVGSTANFSSSVSRAATPFGVPQPGFRLPPPKRWDQGEETSVDKASKYFLLAEMFRGMYVVLEQFFRPP